MVLFPRKFSFGTKSETIDRLRPLLTKSRIPEFLYFSVGEWREDPEAILNQIPEKLQTDKIIVRSSAVSEDSASTAMAGEYLSVPDVNVNSQDEITTAINQVISSYQVSGAENLLDQVLVQEMVNHVSMGGVLFTQDLNNGAPYYVINYDDESGRTDTVSAGNSEYSNRTLLVHRDSRQLLRSERFSALLAAVDEIEAVTENDCIDLEFALDSGNQVYLFQVRQITTQPNWNRWITVRINDAVFHARAFVKQRQNFYPGICGSRSIFGKMPDWNPVEMIGTAPRPLALSLYRTLITDRSWRVARRKMGYAEPHGMPLMVSLAGQPFIDVRLSFHSYLPVDLPHQIGHKLVDSWLDRLESQPHLHDKIEFDIATTALIFDFDERVKDQFPDALNQAELAEYRRSLQLLTANLLNGNVAPIDKELNAIEQLNENRKKLLASRNTPGIAAVGSLLEDCVELGTIPFSILARHAFIASSFLKSMVARNILTENDVEMFLLTVPTVASDFVADAGRISRSELSSDDFMAHYGHLRPGTYDILSPRYDCYQELIDALPGSAQANPQQEVEFVLSSLQENKICSLLQEFAFDISVQDLFSYISKAIKGREYAKFIFSRNVSDALEIIAAWGERNGLSREELSYLDIRKILDSLSVTQGRRMEEALRKSSDIGRREHETAAALQLPYLIFDEADVVIVPLLLNKPNYITHKTVRGMCIVLDGFGTPFNELDGKIVVIEGADPGFDWIFSRPISGLITKFGGANSHMAIRCAEFGLPAAIGCGEQIYDRVLQGKHVEMNCAEQRIEILEH